MKDYGLTDELNNKIADLIKEAIDGYEAGRITAEQLKSLLKDLHETIKGGLND